MRDAFTLVAVPLHLRRLVLLGAAMAGFAVLYAAARHLAGDFGVLGLSDNAVRTLAHFFGYGTLALALAKALFNQYLLSWLVSMMLATGEEIHQLFVPYRFACVDDWLTNAAGITLFLLAAFLLTPAFRRKRAA